MNILNLKKDIIQKIAKLAGILFVLLFILSGSCLCFHETLASGLPQETEIIKDLEKSHNSLYTDYAKVEVEYRKYVSPEPIATVGSETIPSLPACILTVSPTAIHKGDSVILTWESTNADSVVSSNFGARPTEVRNTVGISVSPASTITYELNISGTGGTGSCYSAKVSVLKPPRAQGLWIMDKLVKDIVKDAIDWAVNILAILAILMVVVGGLVYTSSSGDLQRAEFAKRLFSGRSEVGDRGNFLRGDCFGGEDCDGLTAG